MRLVRWIRPRPTTTTTMSYRSAGRAAKRLKRFASSESALTVGCAAVASTSVVVLWHHHRPVTLYADGPPLVKGQVAAPSERQAVSVMDVMQAKGMVAWGASTVGAILTPECSSLLTGDNACARSLYH
jgi:hypothetical protein